MKILLICIYIVQKSPRHFHGRILSSGYLTGDYYPLNFQPKQVIIPVFPSKKQNSNPIFFLLRQKKNASTFLFLLHFLLVAFIALLARYVDTPKATPEENNSIAADIFIASKPIILTSFPQLFYLSYIQPPAKLLR